jgi:surface polysaccharide O-acyltransferase-like enzyme
METTRAFVFFVLGVVTVRQVRRFDWRVASAATILFVTSAIMFYRKPWMDTTLAAVSLIPACAGIAATLAWSRLFAPHPNILIKTLGFLGRYSMSIYVIHILLTAGVRIAMKRLGAHDTLGFTIAEIVAGTTLGIAVPLAFNWAVSKLSVERWFGLQRMETI